MRAVIAPILASLLALAALAGGAAFAAEAEGHITKVDRDKLTITLDDGKTYRLPGEVDLDAIKEGMEVVVAYDTVKGENLITDMKLPD